MQWMVGIDEAGYGPPLGPLVMSAVACRLPIDLDGADFWKLLRPAVRRATSRDARRIRVGDSKLVYSTARGIDDLEIGVLATVLAGRGGNGRTLADYLEDIARDSVTELKREPWYQGRRRLPVSVADDVHQTAGAKFAKACAGHGIQYQLVQCVVICPSSFNRCLDEWGSKGAILGLALSRLLAPALDLGQSSEPIHITIDKHGGRNTYVPLLQNAIGRGMVIAHEETMDSSRYSVLGLGYDCRLAFCPRADARHFCVALASMVSKYVRELLMLDFNEFWLAEMPGLKPTAGYHTDAARFYEQIRPAAVRLNIPETALWRRR
jgi:ribonuclease HII